MRDLVETIIQSDKVKAKSPIRLGNRKQYTVKGHGVIKIAERKPQYTPEEKKYYSKHQSCSLVTNQVSPPMFGHDRREKLVGIMVANKDVLINRMFLYDGGTIVRPYDHHTLEAANDYYNRKKRYSII